MADAGDAKVVKLSAVKSIIVGNSKMSAPAQPRGNTKTTTTTTIREKQALNSITKYL